MSKVWKLLFLVNVHLTGTKDELWCYCYQLSPAIISLCIVSNFADDLRDGLNVTIVSSPKLGEDTICVNNTVNLTCRTDQQVNEVTWYWQDQSRPRSKQGSTITVLATLNEVVYTCEVSNSSKVMGEANVTVVANGEWWSKSVTIYVYTLYSHA